MPSIDVPEYVNTFNFQPNNGDWTPVGTISSVVRSGNTFTLALATGGRRLQVSFLSPTCFRVRFDPNPAVDYSIEGSPAVVKRDLGPVTLTIVEDSPARLIVDTGTMRVHIDRHPYRVRVFRGAQLISADEPSYNLVYAPNEIAIANFKTRPTNAKYCGFGEKAGEQLFKNLFTMTAFNYDNFSYSEETAPSGNNPLNPSIALYATIPLLIETNPLPDGDFSGPPYSYGLFFDNGSQSYYNIGSNDYSNMDGKFYFGALYNQLDYYFFLGNDVGSVLSQYTTLTGRSSMPPRYAFGYHQGCYGYFSRDILEGIADQYRASRIPCDGLHIDIDFQDNYRTFTHSELKFPKPAEMLTQLRNRGFKCSTNITAIMTDNDLGENGRYTPYTQRDALDDGNGLVFNTRQNGPINSHLFQGRINYGSNPAPGGPLRHNPFPYPPLKPNPDGITALGAYGNYPDLGRADVRQLWGQQYAHLVNDLGMDMIWQDEQCPGLDKELFINKTLPLDLMMNNNVTYVANARMHNLYALFMLMATSEGLASLRPNSRNFIIARGGYAGMQRYAALWTGDSASSWEFLRINVPEVLNLGLSGIPMSGCDIGGFAKGSGSDNRGDRLGVTNDNLFTRWMHLGSFLPWYRNHYFGYEKVFQEPFRYEEPVPTNCRKYVELRYRMLQVYYDAMYEWTHSGMPIARALFLNDPEDLAVYDHVKDQFFIGKDFLVAPILWPSSLRDVYLPRGSDWYAFMDNQAPLDPPVTGGTTVRNYFADLDLVPIYVRAGAILPMHSHVEQYVGELPSNPLDINIYPGPDNSHLLYQDDGLTRDAADDGKFRTTEISHVAIPGGVRVRMQRLIDNYAPPETFYKIRLLATGPPSTVTVGGTPVANVGSAAALDAATTNAFFWDSSLRSTVIKVFDTRADVSMEVFA